ncbi:MAG: hypothetical protein R2792_03155 [Saprospiraceae bacterium]
MTYYVHGADGGIEVVFQESEWNIQLWFILRDNRGSALQMVNRANRTMDASWGYSDYGKLYQTALTNSNKTPLSIHRASMTLRIGIYNYKAHV